jgi:hypothetical protein
VASSLIALGETRLESRSSRVFSNDSAVHCWSVDFRDVFWMMGLQPDGQSLTMLSQSVFFAGLSFEQARLSIERIVPNVQGSSYSRSKGRPGPTPIETIFS